jgi:hypothetical protein
MASECGRSLPITSLQRRQAVTPRPERNGRHSRPDQRNSVATDLGRAELNQVVYPPDDASITEDFDRLAAPGRHSYRNGSCLFSALGQPSRLIIAAKNHICQFAAPTGRPSPSNACLPEQFRQLRDIHCNSPCFVRVEVTIVQSLVAQRRHRCASHRGLE